jgi:hypothetical protein
MEIFDKDGDTPVSQFYEPFHGGLSAAGIVYNYLVHRKVLKVVFNQKEGELYPDDMLNHGLVGKKGSVKDHPVGYSVDEEFQVAVPVFLILRQIAKENASGTFIGGVFEALKQIMEKRTVQVSQQHRNGT